MAEIRAVQPSDLDELNRICLATGAGGEDASALYRDPKLLEHVYAAPYAVLSPRSVFVVEDTEGVGGYIVGPPDTPEFETRLEAAWWPGLRSSIATVRRGARRLESRSADALQNPSPGAHSCRDRRALSVAPAHQPFAALARRRHRTATDGTVARSRTGNGVARRTPGSRRRQPAGHPVIRACGFRGWNSGRSRWALPSGSPSTLERVPQEGARGARRDNAGSVESAEGVVEPCRTALGETRQSVRSPRASWCCAWGSTRCARRTSP